MSELEFGGRGPSGPPNTGASQGFPRAAAPVGVFSRGTTRISGSLSCGAREVRSPCAWRGGAEYEAFARYRISREVPCFVIKFEMLLGTLDATPKVPHSSQYEAFARYRVSREVPCFVIKFEMLLGTLALVLLEEGVCYDQCIVSAKLY